MPALLLAGALAAYGWFLWGGRLRRDWFRPRMARSGGGGEHPLARTARRMLLLFGGSGLVGLLLIGRLDAPVTMPSVFTDAQALAARWTGIPAPSPWPVGTLLAAMVVGGVIAGLVARIRRRPPATLGRADMLVPKSSGDLGWALVVSVVAGTCEELFFRLLLPLLIALVGFGAPIGFGVSAILFGIAHRYQGVVGVVTTAVLALLLSAAYLLTGQLWMAMVLHTALDLVALIVRPLVAGTMRRPHRG
ncbi:CPBP family glutamic-type intramembrane protease [Sphingomonas gellani]|uniref:CPBP family glutamic-type intramembrane protease n=1 Tax=Sphingomonas gellani TaxID=1166340 RepID=UPI001113335C|nr:CPBP family glutamic-type intramembrane protease [Sphingomonas gellani]